MFSKRLFNLSARRAVQTHTPPPNNSKSSDADRRPLRRPRPRPRPRARSWNCSKPLIASCSKGQIGALNAESFCERVISAANLVVNEGNTLLSDKHVTMLTVLRMSRDFMEYMRANYNSERERGLHQVGGRPRQPTQHESSRQQRVGVGVESAHGPRKLHTGCDRYSSETG